MARKEQFKENQEIIHKLLNAERENRENVSAARQKADDKVDQAKEDAKAKIEEAKQKARSEADQMLDEAKQETDGAASSTGGASGAAPNLDTMRQHAKENMNQAVEFLTNWVSGEEIR